jgi:hypothetical protein
LTVVIDASILVFLFDANAPAPRDPATGEPIPAANLRIEHLIATLATDGKRLLVPTPALAEVLVGAGVAAAEWLAIISKSSVIRIADFDTLAAVEFAEINKLSLAGRQIGDLKRKIKFDDQIIAIAKVVQAKVIYSDDEGIKRRAPPDITVIGLAELTLPPESAQGNLPLSPPAKP